MDVVENIGGKAHELARKIGGGEVRRAFYDRKCVFSIFQVKAFNKGRIARFKSARDATSIKVALPFHYVHFKARAQDVNQDVHDVGGGFRAVHAVMQDLRAVAVDLAEVFRKVRIARGEGVVGGFAFVMVIHGKGTQRERGG